MSIINIIKSLFTREFLPQQIGAALILLVFILTFMAETGYALVLLVGIGIFDLILYFMKKKTISQWYHALFPKVIDLVILIALICFTWWIFGPAGFLPVCIGILAGHLTWQE
jgi:hypothetical protein